MFHQNALLKWLGIASITLCVLLLLFEIIFQLVKTRGWTILTPQPNTRFTALAVDPHGNLWVGSNRGLYVLTPQNQWQKYGGAFVTSLAVEKLGRVWIATNTGQIDVAEVGNYLNAFNYGSKIVAIKFDQQDRLWVIAEKREANRTHYEYARLDANGRWTVYLSSPPGMTPGALNGIAFDSFDQAWLKWRGVARIDINGQPKMYEAMNVNFSSTIVSAVAVDKQNRVWASLPKGVSMLDANEKWAAYYPYGEEVQNYSDADLALDSQGRVWLAHEARVDQVRFSLRMLDSSGAWTKYTPANSGLMGVTVYKMIVDDHDQIWLATDQGINHFDPAQGLPPFLIRLETITSSILFVLFPLILLGVVVYLFAKRKTQTETPPPLVLRLPTWLIGFVIGAGSFWIIIALLISTSLTNANGYTHIDESRPAGFIINALLTFGLFLLRPLAQIFRDNVMGFYFSGAFLTGLLYGIFGAALVSGRKRLALIVGIVIMLFTLQPLFYIILFIIAMALSPGQVY